MVVRRVVSSGRPDDESVLARASRALTQLYDRELRRCGLTMPQFTLLQVLARVGTATKGGLSRILVLDGTTLSRTLRPLKKRRWIRTRVSKDRRKRQIELTAAGRARLERATPAWGRAQQRVIAQIGDERWNTLMVELTFIAGVTRDS
jgi:DNA-binding MarR family transcriptional regulator